MAGGKGGSGDGDRSIGSRHILGLFFGTVLLCCIFFVLGFVMGRDQSRGGRPETPSKSASGDATTPPGWAVSTSAPGGQAKSAGGAAANPTAPASPAPAPSPAKTSPPASPANAGKFEPPLIPRGAIVLQIAALTKDSDALAMAAAIQEKGFPAFVLTPGTDNFYRVQVGPYADPKSAEQAKRALENEGFKPIVKR